MGLSSTSTSTSSLSLSLSSTSSNSFLTRNSYIPIIPQAQISPSFEVFRSHWLSGGKY